MTYRKAELDSITREAERALSAQAAACPVAALLAAAAQAAMEPAFDAGNFSRPEFDLAHKAWGVCMDAQEMGRDLDADAALDVVQALRFVVPEDQALTVDLARVVPATVAPAPLYFDVPSATSAAVYRVTVFADYATCTCPGWTYRRTCKHVRALAAPALVGPSTEVRA